MSGATIGGVVGAFVGFWIGGPAGAQYGWMIGSAVGGYVDPEQITGPKLQDVRGQTSSVGGAIPKGRGTFPAPGNIIWQQPGVTEHKNTETQGKGGPEVTTFTYTRSYAIMFHLGEIVGVVQVKRNGKIVYDTRSDSVLQEEYEASGLSQSQAAARIIEQRAENTRWLDRCTFYDGTQTQNPDPTIESYEGVGNVPSYRGRAYFVVTDDETQAGEIAAFEVIVCVDGSLVPGVFESSLAPGRVADFINATFPLGGLSDEYEYTGYLGRKGTGGVGAGNEQYTADSIQEIIDYFTAFDFSPYGGGSRSPSVFLGWSASTGTSTTPGIGLDIDTLGLNASVAQPDVSDNFACVLVYNDFQADFWITSIAFNDQCSIGGAKVGNKRGAVGRLFSANPGGQYNLFENCTGDDLYGFYPLCIRVTRKRLPPADGAPPGGVAIPDAPGFYYVTGAGVVPGATYAEAVGTFKVLAELHHTTIDSRDQITNYEIGPAVESADPDYTSESFWTAAYNSAVTDGNLPAGWTYSATGGGSPNTFPRTISPVWESIPLEYDTVIPQGVLLADIVATECDLAGLVSEEYDVSGLTDVVSGHVVARASSPGSVISSLGQIYFFDQAEWDAKARFIKRSGTAISSINDDDLVQRDGDPYEREIVQEFELLRLVTVGYLDPATAYATNTQKWERRVGTVIARGEGAFEASIVLTSDDAAIVAKRKGMTSWGEPEKQKFSLSIKDSVLTPTDIINYTDAYGEVHTIRLMLIDDDSGIRHIESSTNCAEAYNATATGVLPRAPTVVDTSLRGPTLSVYMNLPSLRSQDNVPGVTIAACGVLGGWTGASILISSDGGVSYSQVTTFVAPSTMGRMTSIIATDSNGDSFSVSMYSGTLSSITSTQLAARKNGFAITSIDVSEVGQFQTAIASGSSAYDVSDVLRGQLGTAYAEHFVGDSFVLLDTTQFIPLDISLAGTTLYFKAVTFGTSADSAEAIPFVFSPVFTNVSVGVLTVDGTSVTVGGEPIYVVNNNA